ncbi:MAG: ABC transporter ATP-binding protein, partial [Firmicutes bacterium]|nr:ABC transporter ATP-binding protein [Bacillota bacterium]
MAAIEVKNLSFTYPTAERKALDEVSFAAEQSEFVVLCGKSGCGKSTLLRHLKKNLIPYGEVSGKVFYCGQDVTELDDRINAAQIGFVQQNPDNQLVTDKVWHELAFGLESLGLDNQSIKRRVAEMASFFDIQTWFRKNVSELSGGQKQLLNLASVMVMQPKVLILDEPTSQLDPIAASEFLKTVYRINRELGTTVIISEHRLEELFTMADKVMVMDKGRIIACDEPWNIGKYLGGNSTEDRHPMFYGMPSVMKIYSACRAAGVPGFMRNEKEFSPLTIREGRLWLEQIAENHNIPEVDSSVLYAGDKVRQKQTKNDADEIINIKNLWFRYNKDSGDVLRGLNISVRRGELFCLLGGNGVGKSTTLKAI